MSNNRISPDQTKEAHFFIDVPQDLIDILNAIDYGRISPQDASVFLEQLNQLADKYDVPRRTSASATKLAMVHRTVPDEAIRAVNMRDYSRIPRFAMGIAKSTTIKKLKQMKLLR